ncbi:condensin-2 complex subunit H2-like isoform X1 [Rhopalosiphum padi]|uniref:condensin-2 complex subunit H2-like isoform X1 n=1 Tax=Rhopalosiphum padi TaxID=40932 RepID=UPI00298E8E79|nr:condensin-2 complex subunit H2-like isoform X1 [Rhopalosiphum padi]
MNNISKNESNAEISVRKYQDDSDFDEAFKNLLRPIESIIKKKQCEPLQYDLIKDLDSFLNHLRLSTDGGALVFVEAALMIQNVILIYQKRVDQLIDVMMKLIGKFRAYRINENIEVDYDTENDVGNKKKKKEKKVKFYSSFEPIKGQIVGTLKIFDCKVINLSKKPPVQRIVLNANIKVDNKYSKILPYICIGNGENIGKKYDYMINYPLNRDLAVNEEFDCPTNEDPKSATPLNYRKSTDPLPMNLMEIDDIDEILPSTPDPVIFDQTVTDEVCVANAMLPNPVNILNVSQIPQNTEDVWAPVLNIKDNNYVDKPCVKKKGSKKEDGAMWLPTYTVAELTCQMFRLKSGLYADTVFRQLIHDALEVQRSETAKIKKKRTIAEEKERFDYHDKEMEEKLKNGEEPGFIGFDSPIHDDNDLFGDVDQQENEEPIEDANIENFQSYQRNALDMQKHEQNQIEMMNEQLKMRQRVQEWHNNLRPILEEEEKRTEFDVHEYGTRILSCFEFIGEKKLFRELVGGLDKEEVARYFLSLLMMVNTYNLDISNDISENDISITLLKKERHHEELQVNIGNQVNQEQN